MKKIVVLILILTSFLFGYFKLKDKFDKTLPTLKEEKINCEQKNAIIEDLYIYGRNLNLKGTIELDNPNFTSIKLLLYNNKYQYYNLIYTTDNNKVNFSISDKVNAGILLDNIDIGNYYLFIEINYSKDKKKYYPLINNTKYKNTEYYTISKQNKKINIIDDKIYPTTKINITKNYEENIYDIIIDPGHGGNDSGAINGKNKESTITYQLSSILKQKLEEKGFKVKLTHNGNIPNDETLDKYGLNGRAVIPHKYKAKYLFSIHLNSIYADYVNGLEIYTASNIDYTLATNLAKNLHKNVAINYSKNQNFKINDGIYSRTFSKKEIQDDAKQNKQQNREPYNITTSSNYYYMIRETGGIITGAYVDKRNEKTLGFNPYYDSNIGIESYILELGYITNNNDLKNVIQNKEKYAETISNTIYQHIFP